MGNLGRQTARRKARQAAKLAKRQQQIDAANENRIEAVNEPPEEEPEDKAKPSDALKSEEDKFVPPVMPEDPTFRQLHAYYAAKSRVCLFTPADKYAKATHKQNRVRGLSTADKKLRKRALKALRIFGKNNPIDGSTPHGRLLLRLLKQPGTMERLGIQIDTSTEPPGGIEDADVLPDDEVTDPQVRTRPQADALVAASGLKLTPAQRGAVTLAKAAEARGVRLTERGRGRWCADDQEPQKTGDETNYVGSRTINRLVGAGIFTKHEDGVSVLLSPLGALY